MRGIWRLNFMRSLRYGGVFRVVVLWGINHNDRHQARSDRRRARRERVTAATERKMRNGADRLL